MRIGVVHSFYSADVPSGENASVMEQVSALRGAGHDVLLLARESDEEAKRPFFRLRSATNVVTGRGYEPTRSLNSFRPDVVHVHNVFPNVGTGWLQAWRGPVVHTLHNFRPVCANGLLFRDNSMCTDCLGGSTWPALRHACYRDSRLATLPLAVRNGRGVAANPLLRRSDALIFLSRKARDIFVTLGIDPSKTSVIPNGWNVPTKPLELPVGDSEVWVTAGRLTSEKGVADLVANWPSEVRLDVYGDGPERSKVEALAPSSVRILGSVPRADLLNRLPRYSGLVFPSLCLEMQPTVLVEGLAAGLPLVVRAGGAAEDLVREYEVGEIYWTPSELARCLERVRGRLLDARQTSLTTYERNFTTDAWVDRLVGLYSGLMESPAAPRGGV